MVDLITGVGLDILGLFRTDYACSFRVREMARLLDMSHPGLLPYLNALEKRKILLVKIEGKNKSFSINPENLLSRELISMSEKEKAILKIEEDIFLRKIFIEQPVRQGSLVLFGSFASGTANSESDIDIACIGDLPESAEKSLKNLGKVYNRELHLVRFSQEAFLIGLKNKDALVAEIVKNHLILSGQDFFVGMLWKDYEERKR